MSSYSENKAQTLFLEPSAAALRAHQLSPDKIFELGKKTLEQAMAEKSVPLYKQAEWLFKEASSQGSKEARTYFVNFLKTTPINNFFEPNQWRQLETSPHDFNNLEVNEYNINRQLFQQPPPGY